MEEKKKNQKQKEEFIKKFFPSCGNSPGGTLRLYGKETPNPARNVAMGKTDGSYLTENLKLGFNQNNFTLLGGGVVTANRSILVL